MSYEFMVLAWFFSLADEAQVRIFRLLAAGWRLEMNLKAERLEDLFYPMP